MCCQATDRVVAVSLRLWRQAVPEAENQCCSDAALDLASEVARRLGIEHHVIDLADQFRAAVVDAFLAEVAQGNTPNPCFLCNERIRFGYLLEALGALGAECLATGHYARLGFAADGRPRLLRGVDRWKDQSYMLYRLRSAQLERVLFPVGGLSKSAVRDLAERLRLPVARRPESMDLCWITADGLTGFLDRYLPPGVARPGPIIDTRGQWVGEHRGLPYYTIGQRHGLGVAVGEPAYVVAKDVAGNTLVIGPAAALYSQSVLLRDEHWIAGSPPSGQFEADVQLRYRSPAVRAMIAVGDPSTRVTFATAQRSATPGQGLVAYMGDWCLGGGTIACREPVA